jgi:hypothetical protein
MATQQQLLDTLTKLVGDFPLFAQTCLKIRTKLGQPAEPLALNVAQRYIHDRLEDQKRRTGRVRAVILKGRQQGASTYTEGRFYWLTALRPGTQAVIIAHEQLASDNLFGMANRYHEHMPEVFRPSTSAANAKELLFGAIDSGYKVLTAGSKAVGRSSTAQLLHASEFAYWDNAEEHMAGIGQAVPDVPGSEVIVESTANGLGNAFHRLWQDAVAGKGDYQAIFVPWFWQAEYTREVPKDWSASPDEQELAALFGLTPGQLAWRRFKIDSEFLGDVTLFHAEYPCTPDEAFVAANRDVFLAAADVQAARNHVFDEPVSGPLVMGVDPARFGPDRTAICWRRGREVLRIIAKQGLDTMQVAGLVAHHIKTDKPARVFIDVIGLGAGVVDRLRELGYTKKVCAVNGAERAEDADRYRNRRAEGWARMKEWMRDKPVRIPDADALAQDLLQPGYKYDSAGRLRLESKDDIRKRGAPSPDLGDAVALTFAELISEDLEEMESTSHQPRMADSIGY